MAWIMAAVAVVGTVMDINASKKKEKAIRAANFRRAAQLEEKAGQVLAASQRGMLQQRKQKELVASRALAVAASGGGGASDPTVVNIIADIEGEGAYRESLALYQGEQEAYELRTSAQNLRLGMEEMSEAMSAERTATAIQGAASAYGAYSRANPRQPAQGYG